MADDLKIDPITKDYVDDGAGGFGKTETAATALHHQVHIPIRSWWGDPTVGSRFHELNRAKSHAQTTVEIQDMFRELSLPLVEAGRITTPISEITRDRDRVTGDITVEDTKTEEQIALSDLLPLSP